MKDACLFWHNISLGKGIILKLFYLVIPKSWQVIQGSLNNAELNADQD